MKEPKKAKRETNEYLLDLIAEFTLQKKGSMGL